MHSSRKEQLAHETFSWSKLICVASVIPNNC
jgi:hypothetical protein